MPAPLRMTQAAMQHAIRVCRIHLPSEACGFIVADREDPGLGVRMMWMRNVATNPVRHFRMHPDDVRAAYAEFDANAEEPVAVFHSHPTSEPVMSTKDLTEALDTSIAYLVMSFMNKTPVARAYRVEHFIGNPVAEQIAIQVVGDGQVPAVPAGPWALMSGNTVRIRYRRTGKNSLSTTVAVVLDCDGVVVRLDPAHKTSARMIPLERIDEVHVLKESPLAANTRAQLRLLAGDARTLMAGHDVGGIGSRMAALYQAFPPQIAVTMDPPQ